MNQADTLKLLRLMRMDLTQLQARLTDVIESVASFPAPAGTGEHRGPGRVCGDCGEKFGHGHADSCPRMPVVEDVSV